MIDFAASLLLIFGSVVGVALLLMIWIAIAFEVWDTLRAVAAEKRLNLSTKNKEN